MEHIDHHNIDSDESITQYIMVDPDSQNSKISLGEYTIIITDQNLDFCNWTIDDITMIDDIYNTNHNNSNDILPISQSSPNQFSLPFKNRSKLIIAEKSRLSYITKAMRNDVLIPQYMYMVKIIVDIPGKERYLKNNLIIDERIELLISSFGLFPDTDNVISIFIVRLIINMVVRDFRSNDIVEIVNQQLIELMNNNTISSLEIRNVTQIIEMDASAIFEVCMLLIAKYYMFKTSIMDYQRIATLISVIENIFKSNNHSQNQQLITIRPTFLICLVTSSDLTSLITVMSRIIRSSQVNQDTERRYEIISDDAISNFLSSISKHIKPRIINLAQEINAHQYLIWIWKRYSYPGKSTRRNKKRSNMRRRKWLKIKKMFEHSPDTVFTSMYWVIEGTNTKNDTRDYIKSILIDPITLPYVRKAWRNLYDIYYGSLLFAIPLILNDYAMRFRDVALVDAGERLPPRIYDGEDIQSLINIRVLSLKSIIHIFRKATTAIKYYESLRDIVVCFDKEIQESREIGSKKYINSRPPWISWRQYRDIVVSYDRDFCDNTSSECHDEPILFCKSYIENGYSLKKFISNFGTFIVFIPLKILIDFTQAYSRVAIYHNSESGVSHMLDINNIQAITYNIYLVHILSETQLLNSLIKNLEISRSQFNLSESGIDRLLRYLRHAFGNSQIVIDRNSIKRTMIFLIHMLIETFHIINREIENYYPKIVNSLDYDKESPSKIVKYFESNICDKIIRNNDLVGLSCVVLTEINALSYQPMDSIKTIFTQTEISKSVGYKIMNKITNMII